MLVYLHLDDNDLNDWFDEHFWHFSAYQNNDINEFEKILKTNRDNIMEDPFIREHIEGVWNLYAYSQDL